MGEIADDMLNGLVCEGCGEWMGDFLDADGPIVALGYPQRCSACALETETSVGDARKPKRNPRDKKCPTCKRKFRGDEGLEKHRIVMRH